MPKAPNSVTDDLDQKELASIKWLLVLLLLKAGATQEEIAWPLGVSQSAVSKMLDGKKIRKFTHSG